VRQLWKDELIQLASIEKFAVGGSWWSAVEAVGGDGNRSMAQVAKLMNVSRSTVSRLTERAGGEAKVAVVVE